MDNIIFISRYMKTKKLGIKSAFRHHRSKAQRNGRKKKRWKERGGRTGWKEPG